MQGGELSRTRAELRNRQTTNGFDAGHMSLYVFCGGWWDAPVDGAESVKVNRVASAGDDDPAIARRGRRTSTSSTGPTLNRADLLDGDPAESPTQVGVSTG